MSAMMLKRIPTLDDNELLRLYKNCWAEIEKNSPRIDDARKIILRIHEVWEQRMKSASIGQYKATTPDEGILKALDYKVGKQGEPPHVRRKILTFIMMQRLPFVGSPAYMMEWGEPQSTKRYNKLRSVLHNLYLKSMNMEHFEKASREWVEDRDWLIQHWNISQFKS